MTHSGGEALPTQNQYLIDLVQYIVFVRVKLHALVGSNFEADWQLGTNLSPVGGNLQELYRIYSAMQLE